MYKTVFVKTKKDVRRSTFDRLRSVKIIGEKTVVEVQDAIAALAAEGYEVVNITPLVSGSSSNVGTGGWGFSYTDSVMIVAKKA